MALSDFVYQHEQSVLVQSLAKVIVNTKPLMATQWGIAGAGKISNDFINSLNVLPAGNHNVVAIAAAASKERAQAFADEHKIPIAYGSYEELANNKTIEIVYVSSLNPQHFENAKLFLEHGKAVLCEKPLCLNYKQAEKLIKIAKQKNLFLMEGLWSRCFPVYRELVHHLKSNTVGDVLFVEAQMGRILEVERLKLKEMGGGTVLDLGAYVMQLAILVLGRDPTSVQALGHINKEGVDESMTCTITYKGGRTAVLSTHTKVELPNSAFIVGTKGTIQLIDPFWKPTKMIVLGKEKEFPLPPVKGKYNFSNSVGLSYEAEEVRRCLRSGLKESPTAPHADSLALARLQDTVRAQLGVHFPQDNDP